MKLMQGALGVVSLDPRDWLDENLAASEWWALVDDLRTLPLGQIVAGIPPIGERMLYH